MVNVIFFKKSISRNLQALSVLSNCEVRVSPVRRFIRPRYAGDRGEVAEGGGVVGEVVLLEQVDKQVEGQLHGLVLKGEDG